MSLMKRSSPEQRLQAILRHFGRLKIRDFVHCLHVRHHFFSECTSDASPYAFISFLYAGGMTSRYGNAPASGYRIHVSILDEAARRH